ncbi:SusD/RagB family nutrient-binding outer membrane lipoprotein [Fulvivirgaceae bacterium LMO-SS25]
MKKVILISIVSAMLAGCSELVSDLNQNPNNPTSAPYQFALTTTEVANIILHTGEPTRKAGIFAGQYTGIERQQLGYSNYDLVSSDFNSHWNTVYSGIVRNALVTKELAAEQGIEGITAGITQILRAMALGTAASLWGDVPFDEGGQLEFENPTYEDQRTVYAKAQNLLDDAIANLATNSGRPLALTDIYFDGDPIAWIQVAYTIKARFYMHTKDYPAAYSAAQNGIGTDGSGANNNLRSPHGTALDNANLNYQFFEIAARKSDLVTSDFFASMIDSNPERSPIPSNYRGHAKTNETARYDYLLRTTDVGIQPNTQNNGFAQIDGLGAMATYAENLLILAEAGARADFNIGLNHLNEFREYMSNGGYLRNPNMANLQYLPFVAADFNAGGLENQEGNLTPNDALLREIIEERYVTLFGQIEVFNDTRRTQNETNIRVPVAPNRGTELPQRFLYAQSELDANASTPNPIPNFFQRTSVNQ